MFHIYTDGACSSNPGKGGFASILLSSEKKFEKIFLDVKESYLEDKVLVNLLNLDDEYINYDKTFKSFFSISGSSSHTTNNIMEMTALKYTFLFLIKKLKVSEEGILFFIDSQYVINGMTKWIYGWEKSNWKTSNKSEVKNKDLWKELKSLESVLKRNKNKIEYNWVKGHHKNPFNELADKFAKKAIS